jgi:hypothetical protein
MIFENYLDLVVQTVEKNAHPGSRMMTAAELGMLLRQASPDENWKTFGKRTLHELLSEPGLRGRLEITKTDKGALAVSLTTSGPLADALPIEIFNPLRKSIWEAFVLAGPAGRRFMNRRNETIRVGLDLAPPPADEWVEIVPITMETQREWARAFVADSEGQRFPDAERAVVADSWHPHAFFQALSAVDESAARRWNKFRSSKVSSLVKEWLTQHGLPLEFGFQVARGNKEVVVEPISAQGLVSTLDPEETRRAILSAVASLPLEKLLEIPIPAGLLLSALSKAKARQ